MPKHFQTCMVILTFIVEANRLSIVDPFFIVVLQNDWFFGSWDQDSYVPLEEGREDDEAPSNPSVSKMSCDDDGTFTIFLSLFWPFVLKLLFVFFF